MKTSRRMPGLFALAFAAISFGAASLCPPAFASPVGGPTGQQVDVIVKGVATPFAEFGLIKHLDSLPGVEHTTFHLGRGLAELTLKPGARLTDADIQAAVRSASYTFGSATHRPELRAIADAGPRPVRHS